MSLVWMALLLASPDAAGATWLEDVSEARTAARESGKPILALFHSRPCRVCREFERSTLENPEVRRLLERHILVRIDVDRQRSEAFRFDVRATPTLLTLDAEGRPLARVEGSASAEELRAVLGRPGQSSEAPPPGPREVRALPEGFRRWAICSINVGYGTLALPSQSPFQALRFGHLPMTPSTLAQGQVEVSLSTTWVNVWALDEGEYLLDYEMLQSSAGLRYGLSDILQLEVEYSRRSRFGGSMDGLIQGFHDAAGIDQSGRDEVPRGSFVFDAGGVHLDKGDRGTFSESLLLSMRQNLSCGDEVLPALSASVSVRMDTREDKSLDGQLADVGVSLSAAKGIGNFHAYVSFGLAAYGREDFHGIELRPYQFTILVGVEWRVAARLSLVVQHLASQGVARRLGPFSEPSHEVTLGLKLEFEGSVLQLGLIENLFTFDNSPDFGIHAGITTRM